MRMIVLASLGLLSMAPFASAQDEDFTRRLEDLRKWLHATRKSAEEKFKTDIERIERVFRERAEELKKEFSPEDDETPRDGKEGRSMERLVEDLTRTVRKLEGEVIRLRRELDTMRSGGLDNILPELLKEHHDRLQRFGREFRNFFRDRAFDWDAFGRHLPREFREWGPERLQEFFRERRDWFPKEFDHQRWLDDLHKGLDRLRERWRAELRPKREFEREEEEREERLPPKRRPSDY